MLCFFLVVVIVFTLVLAVVVNHFCFIFIAERCPLLLCFVCYVLFECVVTLCMLLVCCVLLLYYCHRAKTQLQLNK
jgi:hypothetical protein